jgi:hypothetical protein
MASRPANDAKGVLLTSAAAQAFFGFVDAVAAWSSPDASDLATPYSIAVGAHWTQRDRNTTRCSLLDRCRSRIRDQPGR